MCTLTFIPTESGYLTGMNRDELRTRAIGLPPNILERNNVQFIWPREPSGGTWIAGNSRGNLLAILNWNAPGSAVQGKKVKSRGSVIPELIAEGDLAATEACLKRFRLNGILPFRLIAVFRNEQTIIEWRWNGACIESLRLPWVSGHWFSSSVSDVSAETERGRVCRSARSDHDFGTSEWLRSLHCSHEPARGPFSICVHRKDAATVSYTEVHCDESLISMGYLNGSPCAKRVFDHHASIFLSAPSHRSRS